ncbi:MAG: ribbon-helix-helix protein, CopG family [Bdellovibrionales bacterium]
MKPVTKRHFIKGDKVTVSIRLPEELKKELERLAEQSGRGFSDFVQEGLDQWAQVNRSRKK